MDSFVCNRPIVDNEKNAFGDLLISFLKDVGLCIVNGRVNSSRDGFTSVSVRGRAVVDYCLVPWNQLGLVKDLSVFYVCDLCENFGLDEGHSVPDHSVLSWTWELEGEIVREEIQARFSRSAAIFQWNKSPEDFLSSDVALSRLNHLCSILDQANDEHQNAVNSTYSEFWYCIGRGKW